MITRDSSRSVAANSNFRDLHGVKEDLAGVETLVKEALVTSNGYVA